MSACCRRKRDLQCVYELAGLIVEFEFTATRQRDLIAFQELFAWPWFPSDKDEDAFGMAWAPDHPAWKMLSEWAKEFNTTLIAPVFEMTEDEKFYNTSVVYGPDGNELGRYRKVHLPNFEGYWEDYYFSSGDLGYPVFQTPKATIGVVNCYDNFFPEIHRILALKGADLIVAPTAASVNSGRERWLTVLASQAITNAIDIFRVNRVGLDGMLRFYGESFIINAAGELLDQPSGETTAVYLMTFDETVQKEIREKYRFLEIRRPETFEGLL